MIRDDILKRKLLAARPNPSPGFAARVRKTLGNLPVRGAPWLKLVPVSAIVFVAVTAACVVIINNNAVGGMLSPLTPQETQQAAAGDPQATGAETALPASPVPSQDATPTDTPEGNAEPMKTAMPEGLEAIGQYETKFIVNNKPSITNAKLACQRLDGLMLSPGQKLSYLDAATTEATGYQASVMDMEYSVTPILDSSLHATPAGVCQVATTLYDAALLAGLEITEWHQSKLPVKYAAKGLEAHIDKDGKADLVIINNRDSAVWISAKVDAENKKIVITLFGNARQGKQPRKLGSETTLVLPAPKEQVLVEDARVASGDVIYAPPRSGYRVTVTREWLDPATNETSTETLYEAEYPPMAGEVHYPPGEKPDDLNTAFPSPAVTPIPTPAPEETQEPLPIMTAHNRNSFPKDTVIAWLDDNLGGATRRNASGSGKIAYGNAAEVEGVYRLPDAVVYELKVTDNKAGKLRQYFEANAGKFNNTDDRVLFELEQDAKLLPIFICQGYVDEDYIGKTLDQVKLNLLLAANEDYHAYIFLHNIYTVLEKADDGRFRVYVVCANQSIRAETGITIFTQIYDRSGGNEQGPEANYIMQIKDK